MLLYLKTRVVYMLHTVPGQTRALISLQKSTHRSKELGALGRRSPLQTKSADSTVKKKHKGKPKRTSYICKNKHVFIDSTWRRNRIGNTRTVPGSSEKSGNFLSRESRAGSAHLCWPHSARANFMDLRTILLAD